MQIKKIILYYKAFSRYIDFYQKKWILWIIIFFLVMDIEIVQISVNRLEIFMYDLSFVGNLGGWRPRWNFHCSILFTIAIFVTLVPCNNSFFLINIHLYTYASSKLHWRNTCINICDTALFKRGARATRRDRASHIHRLRTVIIPSIYGNIIWMVYAAQLKY